MSGDYCEVHKYREWVQTATIGSKLCYCIGFLPMMRKAIPAVEAMAYQVWLDAGGWPNMTTSEAIRMACNFRRGDDVRVALTKVHILEDGTAEYWAQKIR